MTLKHTPLNFTPKLNPKINHKMNEISLIRMNPHHHKSSRPNKRIKPIIIIWGSLSKFACGVKLTLINLL